LCKSDKFYRFENEIESFWYREVGDLFLQTSLRTERLTGEFPAPKTGIQKVNCGNLASEPLTSTKGRLLIEVPLF
jgi:hypothetical protein